MKCESYEDTGTLRFYQKNKLTTETKTTGHASIFQHGNRLLAMLQREGQSINTRLLTTDEQRSLFNTIDAGSFQSLAYTPYGYLSLERRLMKMLGFKGERPDPVTGHYLLGNGYRAFNPILMRFNSPDSWSPFGKGGINAYTAFDGDPVNKNDPNGHLSFYSAVKTLITKINVIKTWQQATTATLEKMPDVPLRKIVGFLEGDDLVALTLSSQTMRSKVTRNVTPLPVIENNLQLTTADYLSSLRAISLGKKQGFLPSQINNNKEHLSITHSIPTDDLEPGRSYLQKQYSDAFDRRQFKRLEREQQRIRQEQKERLRTAYGDDWHSDTSYDSD
ncbi:MULTISPECIES: RHS repeat-associated core domain-containing protein [unclassified Pseudomonas]|uniref:RHS repeat-associated core domain-containing protein n=2 Tax=Pseudomonas TaxID=286 RepID=UPI0030D8591D